jgi:hypothetical protein
MSFAFIDIEAFCDVMGDRTHMGWLGSDER